MRRLLCAGVILGMLAGFAGDCAAASEPQVPVDKSSMSVAELEAKADALRAEKQYREAIEYFRTALRKDPGNAVLYNKMGMAQLQLGNLRAASSAFDKAIRRDPKCAEALNNAGAIAYVQSKFDTASRYFKKAVALNEANASFHVNLGASWFALNKLDRAIAEYTRALELDPDVLISNSRSGVSALISNTEERARQSYMLAKIYAKRGDLNRSLEFLKKAKQDGYQDLANVYKDEEFSVLRRDARLAEVIAAPRSR